jgi:hypothetical protein
MAIVSSELPDTPEQVTWEERLTQLRALEAQPEPEIDCSEIPEVTSLDGWMSVEEFESYRAAKRKQATTV